MDSLKVSLPKYNYTLTIIKSHTATSVLSQYRARVYNDYVNDPLLKEKGGAVAAPETMSVEDVLTSWSLTQGDIDALGVQLSLVYQANGSSRNGSSMMRGALFA